MSVFDEQDWDAFRYLSREMTAREEEQFEQLLAVDTTACESLVRVSRLIETLARGNSSQVPVVPPARSHSIPARWGVSLAAACLALIAALLIRTGPTGTPTPEDSPTSAVVQGEHPESDLVEIIGLWSRHSLAEEESPESTILFETEPLGDDVLEVPSWMLLAVAEQIEPEMETP